ncbi:MAG: GTPase Era [Spirochaetia bacterium]
MHSGFITVLGRPSAGKSSLINRICGQKISIVSAVPQTTRNTVRGIYTEDRGQIIFLDTPGYHDSKKKFNLHMRDLAQNSLSEVDAVLYVLDSSRKPGLEEEAISAFLRRSSLPIIAAVTKTDLHSADPESASAFLCKELPESISAKVSAATGEGIDSLLSRLFEALPEDEYMYPPEFYTDQDPEFRASEIIREKAIAETEQEVPHALYVDIADMEADEDKNRLWIRAFLVVERKSQKGIVIGKKAQKIKAIRKAAQKELNSIFPYQVSLDLMVKVNPKWRKKDWILKNLIQ